MFPLYRARQYILVWGSNCDGILCPEQGRFAPMADSLMKKLLDIIEAHDFVEGGCGQGICQHRCVVPCAGDLETAACRTRARAQVHRGLRHVAAGYAAIPWCAPFTAPD